jgi:predicted O-methyltransferase YrrM
MLKMIRGRGIKARLRTLPLKASLIGRALPEISLQTLSGTDSLVHAQDPIMDDICMPPYHGANAFDDYNSLISVARWLQPACILELGTAHGNTVANLCRELPNARVITVNAPVSMQTGVLTTYELTESEIGRVYRNHGFSGRVKQVYADTMAMNLSDHLGTEKIDLAIIDACHDRAYVVNDFKKTIPHMRVGGVVLLHDTHPSLLHHLYDSYRACVELRESGYDVKYLKGSSWGVYVAT